MGIIASKNIKNFETEITSVKDKFKVYLSEFIDSENQFNFKKGSPSVGTFIDLNDSNKCAQLTLLLRDELKFLKSEYSINIYGKEYMGYALTSGNNSDYIPYIEKGKQHHIKKQDLCIKIATHYIKIMKLLSAITYNIVIPNKNFCEYYFFRLFNNTNNVSEICDNETLTKLGDIPGFIGFVNLINIATHRLSDSSSEYKLLINQTTAERILKLRNDILDKSKVNFSNWSSFEDPAKYSKIGWGDWMKNMVGMGKKKKQNGGKYKKKNKKKKRKLSKKHYGGGDQITVDSNGVLHNNLGNMDDIGYNDNGKKKVYLSNMDPNLLNELPIKYKDLNDQCSALLNYPAITYDNKLNLDHEKIEDESFKEFSNEMKKMLNNYKTNTDTLLKIVKTLIEKVNSKDNSKDKNTVTSNTEYHIKPITEDELDKLIFLAIECISNLYVNCYNDYSTAIDKLIIGYEKYINKINKKEGKPLLNIDIKNNSVNS